MITKFFARKSGTPPSTTFSSTSSCFTSLFLLFDIAFGEVSSSLFASFIGFISFVIVDLCAQDTLKNRGCPIQVTNVIVGISMGNKNSNMENSPVERIPLSEKSSIEEVIAVESISEISSWLESKQVNHTLYGVLRELAELSVKNKRYDVLALALAHKEMRIWASDRIFDSAVISRDEQTIRVFYNGNCC